MGQCNGTLKLGSDNLPSCFFSRKKISDVRTEAATAALVGKEAGEQAFKPRILGHIVTYLSFR